MGGEAPLVEGLHDDQEDTFSCGWVGGWVGAWVGRRKSSLRVGFEQRRGECLFLLLLLLVGGRVGELVDWLIRGNEGGLNELLVAWV